MPGRLFSLVIVIFAGLLAACQSPPAETRQNAPANATPPRPAAMVDADKPLAYIAGEPVRAGQMLPRMLEAEGGNVLAELVLDRTLERQLAERGIQLTEQRVRLEQQLLLNALDPDPDQAARLLREMRQRRGLGDGRYAALLRRNAALRALVEQDVRVTEAALQQAHREQFGPRYQPRLIVVDRFQQAADLRRQIVEDPARFADLAIEHSIDASAAQGGLLQPISPADPTYPAAVREALVRLDGSAEPVSEAIALETGFALLKLERKLDGRAVEFADIREQLAELVRRRAEQVQMRQLARRILKETNVVVLDPALEQSWRQQSEQLLNP